MQYSVPPLTWPLCFITKKLNNKKFIQNYFNAKFTQAGGHLYDLMTMFNALLFLHLGELAGIYGPACHSASWNKPAG